MTGSPDHEHGFNLDDVAALRTKLRASFLYAWLFWDWYAS